MWEAIPEKQKPRTSVRGVSSAAWTAAPNLIGAEEAA
jgi:hypothetical protein